MEYKSFLFPQLQNIIEGYIDVDLIQLAFDLLDIMPLNFDMITIDHDKYIKSFINDFNDAIEYNNTKEGFIYTLSTGIFYSFVYLADVDDKTDNLIIEDATPIIEKYLELHPINFEVENNETEE